MVLREAIERIKDLKPNVLKDETLIGYINDLEGNMQIEVMNKDIEDEDFVKYDAETDMNTELLIPSPFTEVYVLYVSAMIDFYYKEFDSYNNNLTNFQDKYDDYIAWYNNKGRKQLIMSNYY